MLRRRTVVMLFLFALVAMQLAPRRGGAQARPTSHVDRVADLLARGRAFEERGDPTTALAFYRDAVAAGPRDARGYAALGFAYLSLSEWARAREVFEAGTGAVANSEELWWGLFEAHRLPARAPEGALRQLGATPEAMRALQMALEINPASVRALSAFAEMASEAGAWTSALAAARALASLSASEDESEASRSRLRVRALELLVGSSERVRVHPCPASSAVLSALGRCR